MIKATGIELKVLCVNFLYKNEELSFFNSFVCKTIAKINLYAVFYLEFCFVFSFMQSINWRIKVKERCHRLK